MGAPTLFVPACAGREAGSEVELEAEEATHARALRLRPGDRLEVTDGRGALWAARLDRAEASGGLCTLLQPLRPPPRPAIDLAFGVAKKDRTLWLVEKAVELGVRSLEPVEVARSRSVADGARSAGFWRKAERRAIAALKQCGGARLPWIRPVRDLEEFLDDLGPTEVSPTEEVGRTEDAGRSASEGSRSLSSSERRYLARADASRTLLAAAVAAATSDAPVRLFVGPEGGLERAEVEACRRSGFEAVRLGPRTLRFETAAVAALAVLVQAWEDGRGGPSEGGIEGRSASTERVG